MTNESALALRGRHRGAGGDRRHGLRLAVKVVAALVSATLFISLGYFSYTYNSLDHGLKRVPLSNLGRAPSNPVTDTAANGKSQNILIVGSDSRAGLSQADIKKLKVGHDISSTSTDTIMLVHVPADGSKATLISIPRDSFVDIPGGWAKNKINAAYADASRGSDTAAAQQAGQNLLVETVSNLTGLTINHYIQVGFGGFYTIAKAIGGINIDLCDTVDDTAAHNRAEGNGSVGSGFKMTAGKHHLNPVESLEFVRQRHNLPGIGDDLGREQRQRYFLAQAFHQILGLGVLTNPVKLNHLVDAVKGAFVVDDGFTLQSLAHQMIDLNGNNIVGQTIPTTGTAMVNIASSSTQSSVVTVDPAKVRTWIQQQLDPTATASKTAKPKAPGSASASSSTTPKVVKPAAGCIH